MRWGRAWSSTYPVPVFSDPDWRRTIDHNLFHQRAVGERTGRSPRPERPLDSNLHRTLRWSANIAAEKQHTQKRVANGLGTPSATRAQHEGASQRGLIRRAAFAGLDHPTNGYQHNVCLHIGLSTNTDSDISNGNPASAIRRVSRG